MKKIDMYREKLRNTADWKAFLLENSCLPGPRLLKDSGNVLQVLNILDGITYSKEQSKDRKSQEFKTLVKSLGYCWSVAVSALPGEGKKLMENSNFE